jgi:hypothetical protein
VTAIKQAWQKLPVVVRTTLFAAGRAFLASLVILLPGILAAPDFSTAKALTIAALIAAAAAAVRVVQHVVQGTVTGA